MRFYSTISTTTIDVHLAKHSCLRLTLRSGEVFVVDLCGAQYGYHEPVTP